MLEYLWQFDDGVRQMSQSVQQIKPNLAHVDNMAFKMAGDFAEVMPLVARVPKH